MLVRGDTTRDRHASCWFMWNSCQLQVRVLDLLLPSLVPPTQLELHHASTNNNEDTRPLPPSPYHPFVLFAWQKSPLYFLPAWGGFCSWGISGEDWWTKHNLGPTTDPGCWIITDDDVLHVFHRCDAVRDGGRMKPSKRHTFISSTTTGN